MNILDRLLLSSCIVCRDAHTEVVTLRAERDALREDAERLDWLEQQNWDKDELLDLVNNWTTQDGKRHGAGLRAAIDAARKP